MAEWLFLTQTFIQRHKWSHLNSHSLGRRRKLSMKQNTFLSIHYPLNWTQLNTRKGHPLLVNKAKYFLSPHYLRNWTQLDIRKEHFLSAKIWRDNIRWMPDIPDATLGLGGQSPRSLCWSSRAPWLVPAWCRSGWPIHPQGRQESRLLRSSCRQEFLKAVLRIHDILVRIWIRIRGSLPLTNGPGSGFWSGSCYIRHWPSRRQQKQFFDKVFLLITFWRYITSFFKDKKSKRSHKTLGNKVFLTTFAWW